ncbi:MAG: MMPL family transporter [Thermoplasmatota archaeon]
MRLTEWIAHHPKTNIAVVLTITAVMAFSIYAGGLESTFNEGSFEPDLPAVNAQNEIAKNYSGDYTIQILVRSRTGDLLNNQAMEEVFHLEEALLADETIRSSLQEPSYPEMNVVSLPTTLATIRIVGEAMMQGIQSDQLLYHPYNITQLRKALLGENITIRLENQTVNLSFEHFSSNMTIKQSIRELQKFSIFPEAQVALQQIARTLTRDFNLSCSTLTAEGCIVLISLDGDNATLAVEQAIDDIVEGQQPEYVTFSTIGNRLVNDEILRASNESMQILMPIAMLMVIIVLLIVYRSVVDAGISLLALAFSIIWMYGFGVAMGFDFNPMTTAIPILLIGLGIDYGIHLTMRYREERDRERRERVRITIQTVGVALLLATLTAMIAFLSNLVSPIQVLQEFGILCAFGILSAFITMTLFVPAAQQLRKKPRPTRPKNGAVRQAKRVVHRVVELGAAAAEKMPVAVIVIAVVATAFSGYAATQLETKFDMDSFLPDDLEITQDIQYLMNHFEFAGGEASSSYILIQGAVTSPSLFAQLNATVSNVADDVGIVMVNGRPDVTSIATVMQEYAQQASNPAFAARYRACFTDPYTPKESATAADIDMLYTMLYQGNRQQATMVLNKNGSYDGTLIRIATRTDLSKEEANTLYDQLKDDAAALTGYETKATGDTIVSIVVEETLNEGQTQSLIITILVSFVILTIIFYLRDKSAMLGLITAVPIIFCVGWILGAMYLMGLSLNVMTITIASLTVGLGVTYGIHISHRFVEEVQRRDIGEAAHVTVRHTGISLFGAAATTIVGFGLLSFSLMPPLQQFGQITALTILFAFISSVLVLPSFLILWARRKYGQARPQRQKSS